MKDCFRFWVVFIALGAGCSGNPEVVKQPPVVEAEEGPATCKTVCAHLDRLGCDGAGTTEEGASCEAVCLNVQTSGVIAWDLDCRARARSCVELDNCP